MPLSRPPPPTPPPGPASAVDQIKPSDPPPSIRGRLRNYGYLDGKYPVSAYLSSKYAVSAYLSQLVSKRYPSIHASPGHRTDEHAEVSMRQAAARAACSQGAIQPNYKLEVVRVIRPQLITSTMDAERNPMITLRRNGSCTCWRRLHCDAALVLSRESGRV